MLVIGSNLRKDHPLFAQRIRQAVRQGAKVHAITSPKLLSRADAWAMPVAETQLCKASQWLAALADVAAALAQERGVAAPVAGQVTTQSQAIAQPLLTGDRKAILLGNAAAHHATASSLLALSSGLDSTAALLLAT